MGGLNAGRLNLAAAYLGGAQWALGKAARYVQERKAFLAMLARNEMIAFKLADMETEPHAARSLV